VRTVAVLVIVCVFATGCGAHKARLKRADTAPLISLTQRIANGQPCARTSDLSTLRTRAIALVNRHVVPSELQEPLLSAINELASQAATCANSTVKRRARDLAAWLKENSG
jgi:hypothetical protein